LSKKVNIVKVNGVNIVGQTIVCTVKGNGVTAIKASAGCVWRPKKTDLNNGSKDNSGSWISKRGNLQQALKYKEMFDNGCSRHMTGNKALLTDYQDIDGGLVAFGGSTRGGKITGIGKIKTNKIDFEDVFFVKELKFNLFSVSQLCDKKNSVLFTETECLNVVPSGDLTCLFAKATIDESKLWHRRLGHVNFKTMNKLVKGNLVRGLPSKTFENDHTCVACQKGKQHKASCKTKQKTPRIRFMRPFGCPVTILNTLDPLGKFDGKAEEGFLVGYSVNSKAFRVFNTETRKVEENLHVNFLENKPNVVGQRPNWLFDIDSLTNSMNYQPVTAENQTNKNAGPQKTNGDTGLKKNVDAGHTEEENVSSQQYIVFPLWSSISSSYKSSDDKVGDATTNDAAEKEVTEQSDAVRKEFEAQCNSQLLQEKVTRASSTNSFNTISIPVNTASASRTFSPAGPSSGPSFDPLMPGLEDTAEIQSTVIFNNAYDDDDLETHNSPNVDEYVVQTRGMKKKNSKEHAMISYIQKQRRKNHKDFQNCLFACFLSQHEPIKISQAFNDESWVGAMHEELLQFKIQKVWTLVDLPYGKKAIGTNSTKKSLCDEFEQIMHNRFQMSSIGELTFFLGLQVKQKEDGIFISQDKYVGEILKKFGLFSIRSASTPMETYKALIKDEDGKDVDVHLYRLMIRSLMYLTSSKPDIMFSVCACSRFQVQPRVSHLNAIKMIFRYLKGQPKLGLWYPKDSPLILEAFSDSDYACSSLDRKSTIGGCQFLGSRLITWQCKKQTVVANYTTKAEYIAASHCCRQVLWIQNQMLDYGYNFMQTKIHVDNEIAIYVIKNPVYHSKTKHIEIRHHFIRDSYEKRLIKMVKIHTDHNVVDLLTKAFDVSRFNFLVASIGMLNP
ncbi:putative ribonuclease H-like domain-containing protein, partial [Tanacetum coccineum]